MTAFNFDTPCSMDISYLHALYFSALVQCHLDGNRIQDASAAASHALSFIRNNFPAKFKELFGIVVSTTGLRIYYNTDGLILANAFFVVDAVAQRPHV